ncbi:MAG: transcription termination factor NusA [Malacoplasma sp.]
MGIHATQLFNKVNEIALAKEIDQDKVIDVLKTSIEKAYLKENPDCQLLIEINEKKKDIKLFELKTIVDKSEDEIDDDIEISLEDAKKLKENSKLGDSISVEIDLDSFEKRMAIHVLQIFQQRLNEVSNSKIYEQWQDKIGKVVRAEVERVELKYIEVNLGTTMGVLLKSEQIPNEVLVPGESYLFLIKDIKEQSRGWPIILSRADEKFLDHLLVTNIPEIEQGIIEIKSISRIAGFKAKIALSSNDPNVDPIGTCVGVGGKRIKDISAMINNERIDIILYSDNPKQLLVNACSPEKIIGLEITNDDNDEELHKGGKIVTIVCKDEDLPKLIGRGGVNVKLLSRLTKWSIDIVSLTMAVEDKIKYEDVSNLSISKFDNQGKFNNNFFAKRQNNFSGNSNNPNAKKDFSSRNKSFGSNSGNDDYNNSSFFKNGSSNTWDSSFLKKVDEITDEDVENLLNFNSTSSAKKKKKSIQQNDNYGSKKGFSKPKKEKVDILDEYENVSEDDLHEDNSVDKDFLDFDDLE